MQQFSKANEYFEDTISDFGIDRPFESVHEIKPNELVFVEIDNLHYEGAVRNVEEELANEDNYHLNHGLFRNEQLIKELNMINKQWNLPSVKGEVPPIRSQFVYPDELVQFELNKSEAEDNHPHGEKFSIVYSNSEGGDIINVGMEDPEVQG